MIQRWLGIAIILVFSNAVCLSATAREPSHGFAYFGNLKYPKDMKHFDYVNPDAPKGGTVKAADVYTFTNLNPYVDKGVLAAGMDPRIGAITHDPLMKKSEDELASYYGALAESIEVADDLSWVTYTLRDDAYWHDGVPVTMDDVEWTFDMIKNKAGITWRIAYADFVRLERVGSRSFTFHFSDTVEKTSQLIIQSTRFTTLPRHYWQENDIGETTLVPHLGNGPYRVTEVDIGRKVVFERVKDYWGRNLNVNAGKFNFDRYEFMYFFDKNVMLQALRAGVFDYYRDQDEKTFATAYDFVGLREGLFNKESYQMGESYGMHYGVVFNTRRAPFDDIRVREALTLAYNFEWANRVFWHDGMDRNNSYFMRSGLQAKGLPSADEVELLEPFRDSVPERVFTQPVDLPRNEPFGRNRNALNHADELLRDAGWIVKDFRRVNAKTGERLAFQIVVDTQMFDRMLTPFVDNLRRLGIDAVIRKVETNIMTNRLRTYDYDTTVRKFYTYRVPFPDRMRSQFAAKSADPVNMTNYAGIKNPVVDYLIEKVARATTEKEMNAAGRALDRVLLWNFYLIPDGHPVARHIVYWDRFGHPPLGREHMNWVGFPHLWWLDEAKSARVETGIADLQTE